MHPSFLYLLVVAAAGSVRAADVCSVSCDKRDPSTSQEDKFPVADKALNGRQVRLHVSEADAMAWASVDKGSPGDQVWLDRSWDGGKTWDGKLGKAAVPKSRTGARTLMYNLADPVNHRRGLLRACANAGAVGCTPWFRQAACDAACDGAGDPQGDAKPVGSKTLAGRTISLHVDDRGMFWGTIEKGAAGDEVWLDRSWDEGKTRAGGESLGRKKTGSGGTGARTPLFAARDPKMRLYGGAVRACGKAVSGASGACTAWARAPSKDRAAAAADALMWAFQPDTAWWRASWWNSAVTVTALMDWMYVSGRKDYLWAVDRVFEVNKAPFKAGVKSGDELEGHFISRAIDDTAWWGLAWVRAYELTGDKKYIDEAVTIADYVHQYWDTKTCGGGMLWSRGGKYKNAVTVGLYIRLSAALHNRLSGDSTWRDRAVTAWNWFAQSTMINADGLVNDGLNNCKNNGQAVHSYNQGLAIGGALEVYRITGNASLLDAATRLADDAMRSPVLTVDGLLTEACDTADKVCNDNGKQFKGIFMRYFGDLANATRTDKYTAYVRKQADAVWAKDRDSFNRLGQRWNGLTNDQFPNARDWRTQASGLGALVAAIGL